MNRKERYVLLFIVLWIVFISTVIFVNSLPNFCTNPNGSGNWIVQPLCVK